MTIYNKLTPSTQRFFDEFSLIVPDTSAIEILNALDYATALENNVRYDLVYLDSYAISAENLRKCDIIIKQNGYIAIRFYSKVSVIKFMLTSKLKFEHYDFIKNILLCRKAHYE